MRMHFTVLAGVLAGLALNATTAAAADTTSTWGCTASALRAKVADQADIEPLIANKDKAKCEADTVGVDNAGPSLFKIAGAEAARAKTVVDETKAPAGQSPKSSATIANVRLTDAAPAILELPGTIASEVSATCTGLTPVLTATSSTVPLKIGGQTIPTDKPVTQLLTSLGQLTNVLLIIKPGEEIRTADSLTRRGLHIQLHSGNTNILDLVLAESTVKLNGNPCANTTGDGGGGGNGGGGNGGGVNTPGGGGPNGPGLSGGPTPGKRFGGALVVVLGSSLVGPKGSPCVTGPFGRRVGLIGTIFNDRLVGSRLRDRIFLRPGNDIGYAGYGNDCVEGAQGNDIVYGSRGNDWEFGRVGNDRLYGMSDNDRLVGYIGNDYLHGGTGNDRLYGMIGNDILAGSYGNDRIYGGVGNDSIVPGQGRDVIYAGPGNDLVDARKPGNDVIHCGRGVDRVRAKRGDKVAADCEKVALGNGRFVTR